MTSLITDGLSKKRTTHTCSLTVNITQPTNSSG